jgi:Calx-beta domain
MPRHVRFRAAWGAVIAGLAGAAAVGAVGSSATPAGAQAPPTPTIEVAPTEGAAIGDTLTVTGSGFVSVPLGRPPVALCAAEPFAHGTPYSASSFPAIEAQCAEPVFADVAGDGTFTVELPVTTAAAPIVWAGGAHLGGALTWMTATAPVTIEAPTQPSVRVSITSEIAYAGQAPQARAVFDEVPDTITARPCRAGVLDAPASPDVVTAACQLGGAVTVTADAVGEVVASVPLPAGTEALWFGGPAATGPQGGAVAIDVFDPRATVTPSRDLTDGQTVRLRLDDLGPAGRGHWGAYQCDSRVLSAGPGLDPTLWCTATGVPGEVAEDGTLTVDLTVVRNPVLGPVSPLPAPDCARAARTCAVIAFGFFDDGQPSAYYGVPISFATGGLPAVVPHAAAVAEGDGGAVTAQVPVTLSAPSSTPVTVNYTTFDPWPALSWAATSGTDYTPASGTLTFAPGETSKTIAVSVLGDTAAEGAEMALVGLSDASGATIGGFAGIGGVSITDDD